MRRVGEAWTFAVQVEVIQSQTLKFTVHMRQFTHKFCVFLLYSVIRRKKNLKYPVFVSLTEKFASCLK